ncbi:MAG: arginase [Betaproteobacteria bacterium]|nr:arginase [Betaproteobacteria bacterium]
MTQERQQNRTRTRVEIIGVRSGVGGRDAGAAGAVNSLRAAGLAERLQAGGLDARWGAILQPARGHAAQPTAAMSRLGPRLAQAVSDAIGNGAFPLVIGGDHSCAVGTWSGVAAANRGRGTLGLLWVDAHLDSHTPQTSHTGLIYGMPLAALLGHGDAAFTDCLVPGAKVLPQHVCVLGARSYEPEERALLDRIGVRVIGMEEITRRGVADALAEAVAIVGGAPAGYGITLDLDVIDPRDAPGVGTPAPGGMRAQELIEALALVAGDSRLRGFEIAEYNPRRDRNGVTLEHALAIAEMVLGAGSGEALQRIARVA